MPKTASKERDRFLGPAPGSFHWLPRRRNQGNPQNRNLDLPGKDKIQAMAGKEKTRRDRKYEKGKMALEKRLVISNFQRNDHTK